MEMPFKRWFSARRRVPDAQSPILEIDAALQDESKPASERISLAFMQFHAAVEDDRRQERVWRRRRNYAIIIMAVSGTVASVLFNAGRILDTLPPKEYIALVSITGDIGADAHATGEAVVPALKAAFEDEKAKRILLRIDSGGGRPHDAEEITTAIEALRAKHKKPVDAVIETIGASAAYMIAARADTIYVGRYSIAGSVGALLESWNWSKITDRFDVRHDTYVSGNLKDLLNPFRATREDERAKVQGMVDMLASVFADEVIAQRKGKLKLERPQLMSGEVWIGQDAIKLGLADAIGTVDSVSMKYDLKLHSVGPFPERGITIPFLSRMAGEAGRIFGESVLHTTQAPRLDIR